MRWVGVAASTGAPSWLPTKSSFTWYSPSAEVPGARDFCLGMRDIEAAGMELHADRAAQRFVGRGAHRPTVLPAGTMPRMDGQNFSTKRDSATSPSFTLLK